MKSLLRTVLIAVLLLVFAFPAAAQDPVNLDDTTTVVVPEGWEIMPAADFDAAFADVEGLTAHVVTDGTVAVLILTPSQLEALFTAAGESVGDPPVVLVNAYSILHDSAFDVGTIAKATIAGFEAQIWGYTLGAGDDAGEGKAHILTVNAETNALLFINVYGPTGSLDPVSAQIDALVNSLAVVEAPVEAAPAGEPCIVNTDKARTATVRVGPGENRTAITFLKPNQDYTVEGRLVDASSAVWYRLVKTEVDPGTSAAELWTAAEGLNAVGGCDTVGEAVAPPLRPIIQARPTSVPGSSTTTTTDPAEGLIIPESGTWLFLYNSNALVSCQGTNTIEVPISELDWPPSEVVTIESSPDGSFLYVGDFLHVRINDTAYLGDYNVDGSNIQAYLFPQSSTRLSGEFRENFVWDGWSCSGTIRVSGSLQ